MRIAETEADEVLLRRVGRGDEAAFTLLYRRHQAAMYRFALRMSGQRWAAEEIVQDVFMALVKTPNRFDASRGTLSAFLYGITRNKVLKHLERSPREISLEEKAEPVGGPGGGFEDSASPAALLETAERRNRVRAAVLDLPAEFREAVILCDLEELSYEEAARIAQCPIGTIRSRLHRGRALLMAQLEILRETPKRLNAVSAEGGAR